MMESTTPTLAKFCSDCGAKITLTFREGSRPSVPMYEGVCYACGHAMSYGPYPGDPEHADSFRRAGRVV